MANVNYLNRPNTVKVFASEAMDSRYLPVKFGTNRLATKDIESITNKNFEYGLESLEGDIQPRDLNAVLKYVSSNLAYLFQQGIAEFSPYQDYPANALVQFDGGVWISTKEIQASKHEFVKDPCNPCSVPDCEVAKEPSKENGWCKLVSHCTYDNDLQELKDKDTALEKAITDLKGVTGFTILPNTSTGALELTLSLSDGSSLVIPMAKFGNITQDEDGTINITNANGSKLELPKYVAEKSLNQDKGFFFNTKSEKWEVDLADLVKDGSGLEVDKNGYISVKPSDLVDNDTLHVNANTGKVELNPKYVSEHIDKPSQELKDKIAKNADDIAALKDKESTVSVKNPIMGDGSKANPLSLNLGEDFTTDSSGKLILNATAPQLLGNTSLISNQYKLGFHTFTGYVKSNNSEGSLGLPTDFHSDSLELPMAKTWSEYKESQNYDFNGYYIASGAELNVWVANNGSIWTISNDGGVNNDGSLKDPNSWGKWQKLDNAGGVTDQMTLKMQNQINSLAAQVTSLSNTINSFIPLKDASGKTILGYIKP